MDLLQFLYTYLNSFPFDLLVETALLPQKSEQTIPPPVPQMFLHAPEPIPVLYFHENQFSTDTAHELTS